MKSLTIQAVVSLVLAGCLAVGQAAPPAIGTVVASGGFQLDDARVSGNATVFDGTTIQAGSAGSQVRLNSGARLSLGAGTRGRVYQDHLSLERGEGRLDAAAGYAVRARSLRITSDGASASGRVALAGAGKVQVAALNGALRVMNSQGLLVARLASGTAMEFEPQAAGAAAPSRLTGCLQKKGARFLLTDETTNVTVELQGGQLQAEAGNRVEIVGAMDPSAKPAADVSQLIKVSEVKRLAKGCGGKGAAAGAAGAAGWAGLAVGAKAAIIGGVAAAGLVGGLAAAEKLPGQGDDKPSASR
ncbi:MAG: hypothetical protein HY822_15625 [Acidobacteria bacterium]|nr:hypothetical protein [Acidobacteriota bacterium]